MLPTRRERNTGNACLTFVWVILLATISRGTTLAQDYMDVRDFGTEGAIRVPGPRTPEDLVQLFREHRAEYESVLREAGWPGDPGDLFEAVEDRSFTVASYPVGHTFDWMSVRRGGVAGASGPVRWAGSEPFTGFEIRCESRGRMHRFVVSQANGALLLVQMRSIAPPLPYPTPATSTTSVPPGPEPWIPPPVSAGDRAPVARYPTMKCPDSVTVRQPFNLQVALTRDLQTTEVLTPDGAGAPIEFPIPEGENEWLLEVLLHAPGFTFDVDARPIVLYRDADSTPVRFTLTPTDEVAGEYRELEISFYHEGRYLARATRGVTVRDAATPIAGPQAPPPASLPAPNIAQPPLGLGPDRHAPDLTIRVIGEENGKADLVLSSGALQEKRAVMTVDPQLRGWIELRMAQVSAFATRGLVAADVPESSNDEAVPTLVEFGRQLYQNVVPDVLRSYFWSLKDELQSQGRELESIHIISDDPWIPWELMRPSRDNGSDEGDFLGIDYRVSRWHLTKVTRTFPNPPQQLDVEELVGITPRYEDTQALPSQDDERQALEAMAAYRPVRGRIAALRSLLSDPPSGIIHFAGHGRIESGDIEGFKLVLEDAEVDDVAFRGMFSTGSEAHPFVFVNACHLGQTQSVANFVQGWAPAVLESGGSGYIGGLWPLGDRAAAEAATTFYRELRSRARGAETIHVADLVKEMRRLFYVAGNSTFLAYVYYGDPDLVIELN